MKASLVAETQNIVSSKYSYATLSMEVGGFFCFCPWCDRSVVRTNQYRGQCRANLHICVFITAIL